MNLSDTHFPYPVISQDNDSYKQTKFEVSYHVEPEIKEYKCQVEVTLEDENLQNLIKEQKAQYLLVWECRALGLRKTEIFYEDRFNFKINFLEVAKVVNITTYIVAKDNLMLASSNFNDDYMSMNFPLEKGDILGIEEGEHFEVQDDSDKKNIKSIIAVDKLDNPTKKYMQVSLDGERIIILLPEKNYNEYRQVFKAKLYKPILISMLVMPALLRALDSMKNDGVTYEDKLWSKVIIKRCVQLKLGGDPEEWFDTMDIIQKIIENQLSHGLEALTNIEGE